MISEVSRLREEVEREKERVRQLWRMNCEQIAGYDNECAEKDTEIARLRAGGRVSTPPSSVAPSLASSFIPVTSSVG